MLEALEAMASPDTQAQQHSVRAPVVEPLPPGHQQLADALQRVALRSSWPRVLVLHPTGRTLSTHRLPNRTTWNGAATRRGWGQVR